MISTLHLVLIKADRRKLWKADHSKNLVEKDERKSNDVKNVKIAVSNWLFVKKCQVIETVYLNLTKLVCTLSVAPSMVNDNSKNVLSNSL